MENEEEENGNVRERESCLKSVGLSEERERELLFNFKKKSFFLISYYFIINYATCLHLSGAKRAHFPFLTVTHTQPQK